ncbi:MAG: hypothetical protein JO277_03090 [Candidatus Eremiobacteraeota bacterium]|nr:hypothetical protein [Candidatus Eremiobacteraeota bacterium]
MVTLRFPSVSMLALWTSAAFALSGCGGGVLPHASLPLPGMNEGGKSAPATARLHKMDVSVHVFIPRAAARDRTPHAPVLRGQ